MTFKEKISQIGNTFWDNITLYVVIFLTIYAILPILSPIAFKVGLEPVGQGIQFIYRIFCHQRVDRSAFLFGEEGLVNFYTIDELRDNNTIPRYNKFAPTSDWVETYYAYPYWGNNEVGYKMTYCIRDFGLYTVLAITSVLSYVYMIKKKKLIKIAWQYLVLLMIPMVFDGLFQMYVELLGIPGIEQALQDAYVTNIPKRIITGALFGLGFGLLIIPALKESTEDLKETK